MWINAPFTIAIQPKMVTRSGKREVHALFITTITPPIRSARIPHSHKMPLF
jgi:hypothetical protein